MTHLRCLLHTGVRTAGLSSTLLLHHALLLCVLRLLLLLLLTQQHSMAHGLELLGSRALLSCTNHLLTHALLLLRVLEMFRGHSRAGLTEILLARRPCIHTSGLILALHLLLSRLKYSNLLRGRVRLVWVLHG